MTEGLIHDYVGTRQGTDSFYAGFAEQSKYQLGRQREVLSCRTHKPCFGKSEKTLKSTSVESAYVEAFVTMRKKITSSGQTPTNKLFKFSFKLMNAADNDRK